MSTIKKIGFIGVGNMAGAIINGIKSASGTLENVYIYDVDNTKYNSYKQVNINTTNSICQLIQLVDIVVLAVKPQNFTQILPQISCADNYKSKLYVTIAAGISIDYLQSQLGKECKIVRVMPNTPLLISHGASAMSKSDNVLQSEFEIAENLFSGIGVVESIDESLMNEIIGVNGSSPAYIYLFAKAVCDAAASQGIDPKVAINLFANTLIGSAKMLLETNLKPDQLIDMVTSKGGTTFEAMKVLYNNNFEQIIAEAMLACTKRAYELSQGK